MQVVVDALQLGERRTQQARPFGHRAAGGLFHRLAEGQRMREAADAGDPLGERRRLGKRQPLEALLHAAMLEEELRVKVEDVLADIEERELGQLDDVGPHRPERQLLHVRPDDLGNRAVAGGKRHRRSGGIGRVERRQDRLRALMQHEATRLRMPREGNAEEIADFALVPAEQRTGVGGARHRAHRARAPDLQPLAVGAVGDVAQLDLSRLRVPGIGELHASACLDEAIDGAGQIGRFDRGDGDGAHGPPGDRM